MSNSGRSWAHNSHDAKYKRGRARLVGEGQLRMFDGSKEQIVASIGDALSNMKSGLILALKGKYHQISQSMAWNVSMDFIHLRGGNYTGELVIVFLF